MINKAEKIITNFSLEIKPKFPAYAAIYTSFIEYLKETKEDYDGSFYEFFENDFSKNDINNRNLFAILPFGNLKTIVYDKIKDLELKEKSSIPPIDENTANILIKFLQDNKRFHG